MSVSIKIHICWNVIFNNSHTPWQDLQHKMKEYIEKDCTAHTMSTSFESEPGWVVYFDYQEIGIFPRFNKEKRVIEVIFVKLKDFEEDEWIKIKTKEE